MEGNRKADQIMRPLGFGTHLVTPEQYNRIYEAVMLLPEKQAANLVAAIVAALAPDGLAAGRWGKR